MSKNNFPTIQSYGEYHGQNYGLNSLVISFSSGIKFYYSYDTIIAFFTPDIGLIVSENCWSNTTGKHLNWIDGGDKKSRLKRRQFEVILHSVLIEYGLEEEDPDVLCKHIWELISKEDKKYRCKICGAILDDDGGIIS